MKIITFAAAAAAAPKLKFLSLLIVLFSLTASVQGGTFFYWDKNGATAGAGGPTPTGTWGVDAYWNEAGDGMGTAPSQPYPAGGATVAFSAGSDATGTYSVNVSGTQNINDIHFDEGVVTLQGGTLAMTDNATGPHLISVAPGVTARINSVITEQNRGGALTLTKYKTGTLILGGASTYSSLTTIEGGIVRLALNNALPATTTLILANGDTRTSDNYTDTPATFATGGFNQTLGALQLTGPNPAIHRTIDFGAGTSALVIGDSSGQDWAGIPLWVTNYTSGVDSLRFGIDANGLTATQLGLIHFAGFSNAPGQISASGLVTPSTNYLPVLQSATIDTNSSIVTVTWSTVPTRSYRLQYNDTLGTAGWTDIAPDITATGSTASNTDTLNGTQRFYRVLLLP